MINGWSRLPSNVAPTAHSSVAEEAAISLSPSATVLCSPNETDRHAWPFQWRSSDRVASPLCRYPVAQTSFRPIVATSVRKLSPLPKFGVGTAPQDPPFQCIANVRAMPSLFRVAPPAQTSLELIASTSFR